MFWFLCEFTQEIDLNDKTEIRCFQPFRFKINYKGGKYNYFSIETETIYAPQLVQDLNNWNKLWLCFLGDENLIEIGENQKEEFLLLRVSQPNLIRPFPYKGSQNLSFVTNQGSSVEEENGQLVINRVEINNSEVGDVPEGKVNNVIAEGYGIKDAENWGLVKEHWIDNKTKIIRGKEFVISGIDNSSARFKVNEWGCGVYLRLRKRGFDKIHKKEQMQASQSTSQSTKKDSPLITIKNIKNNEWFVSLEVKTPFDFEGKRAEVINIASNKPCLKLLKKDSKVIIKGIKYEIGSAEIRNTNFDILDFHDDIEIIDPKKTLPWQIIIPFSLLVLLVIILLVRKKGKEKR